MTILAGPWQACSRHRTYPIAFKRQVAQEFLAGEVSLFGLAKRHDICRNLIRVWVEKYERGEFDRICRTGVGPSAGQHCPRPEAVATYLATLATTHTRGTTGAGWSRSARRTDRVQMGPRHQAGRSGVLREITGGPKFLRRQP